MNIARTTTRKAALSAPPPTPPWHRHRRATGSAWARSGRMRIRLFPSAEQLMSWARIDDGFDDHPKVLAVLEYEQGAAAIGLWTLCLTWAHRNTRRRGKVPGLLPASLPRRYLGPGARDLADLLVTEKLWEDRSPDGWMIHDFERYLPTEQTRDARSAAGKRGAQARWGNRAGRDSNLPSDDGKPMAADSTDSAFDDDEAAADQDGRQPPSEYGNEPSADSNLPSGLLFENGKPMASDGSRALARRAISKEIAPTPVPVVPATPDADKPRRRAKADDPERAKNAGHIVAAYIEGALAAGQDEPATSLKARVGRDARQLLAEGKDPESLIAAAYQMGMGEWNDLAVQLRKGAAANGHGPAVTEESTATQRARQGVEAGLRVQQMIDQNKGATRER